MLRTSRRFLLIAATVSLPLVFTGCSHPSSDEGEASATNIKAEVTLAQVVRANISQYITLTGTAGAPPNQDVKVSSLVPGRVIGLTVAEGDYVQSGEVVAKLDDRPYLDQLQQAEATEAQAKAGLENAQLNLARNQSLVDRGIGAGKDLEDARMQQAMTAATLQQAEAALRLANLQVTRTQIVSPFSGVVVKRFVSDGEQVDGTAAQPIVEVVNLQILEFLSNPPAAYLGKMHPGEQVLVTSQAIPGKKFTGHVVAVSPAVDPATGVGLVRIRVPNPDGLLRLGMFLSADVPVATHTHVLCIPGQALYHDEFNHPLIYLVKGKEAKAAPVTPGIEAGDLVELEQAEGIKEGDSIILEGGYGLGDKVQIEIKTPEEKK